MSLPQKFAGVAILVANHRSSVDPFFVQLAAGRRVHWMVAKEYCQHAIFGAVLKPLQVIPTNRSGIDTSATKQAIRLAKEGRLVGMFPEGRINRTVDPLLPIRSGAALVAMRANVPLIPIWISGSPYDRTVWSPLFIPARVGITFGTPIPEKTPNTTDAPSPTTECTGEETGKDFGVDQLILQWANQVVRLAGQPRFQVQLAGSKRRARHQDNS